METSALFFMVQAFLLVSHIKEVSSQSPLVNKNGKCLTPSVGLIHFVQSTCTTSHVWNYNNELAKDRHLCHVYGCAASPSNYAGNTLMIKWDWVNEKGQRFTLQPDQKTGYFRIVNDWGKCLSVGQDSKNDGAWIYAWDCNTYEDGQLWQWY